MGFLGASSLGIDVAEERFSCDDVKRRPSDGKGRIGGVGLYASAGTR